MTRRALLLCCAVSVALAVCMAPRAARADTLVNWTPQELKETVVPGYSFKRTVSVAATRDLDDVVVSVPSNLAQFVRAEPSTLSGIKKGQGVEVSLIISAPPNAKLRSAAGSIRLQPAGTSSSVSKPLNVSVNVVKPSVVVLSAHPKPAQLAAARDAFRAGHIVEMLDGTADDLNALLGLGVAKVQSEEQAPGPSATRSGILKAVAVHATPNGSVRQFQGLASGSAASAGRPQKDTVWQTPLTTG